MLTDFGAVPIRQIESAIGVVTDLYPERRLEDLCALCHAGESASFACRQDSA